MSDAKTGNAKMANDPLEAAQRLADVLARENEALKRLDFRAAVALIPAKEAALADLTESPATPMKLTPMAKRLVGLAAENQTLLERAIAVQTRIVRIVARAAAPPPAVTRYGVPGGRTPAARAGALALSTRV
jgi:hypothetical protein